MAFAENKLTRTFSPFQRLKDRSAIGFIIMLFGVLWMTPVQAGTNNKAAPLVAINTIALDSSGNQGIAVGLNRFCGDAADAPKCFYENPGQSSDVQMLVLDRTTVQPVSFTGAPDGNLNFSTDASGLTSLNSALVSLKATSPDNVLVILAYDSTDCVDFSLIIDGLQAIGQQRIPPECRPWSIIGVPGMVAGNAAINIDTVINNSATGGLKGYLRDAALVRNGIQYLGRIFDFGYAEGYTVTPVSKPANYQQASIQLGSTTRHPPPFHRPSRREAFLLSCSTRGPLMLMPNPTVPTAFLYQTIPTAWILPPSTNTSARPCPPAPWGSPLPLWARPGAQVPATADAPRVTLQTCSRPWGSLASTPTSSPGR